MTFNPLPSDGPPIAAEEGLHGLACAADWLQICMHFHTQTQHLIWNCGNILKEEQTESKDIILNMTLVDYIRLY